MDKIEIIKQAYGKHWETVKDFVDSDGWATRVDYSSGDEVINFTSLNDMGIFESDNYADVGYDSKNLRHVWRPKSLDGIENNNGWIKVSDTLPTNIDEYDVVYTERFFYPEQCPEKKLIGVGYFNGKEKQFVLINSRDINDQLHSRTVTHWKEKNTHKMPIY